jgi:hypothetical protein
VTVIHGVKFSDCGVSVLRLASIEASSLRLSVINIKHLFIALLLHRPLWILDYVLQFRRVRSEQLLQILREGKPRKEVESVGDVLPWMYLAEYAIRLAKAEEAKRGGEEEMVNAVDLALGVLRVASEGCHGRVGVINDPLNRVGVSSSDLLGDIRRTICCLIASGRSTVGVPTN